MYAGWRAGSCLLMRDLVALERNMDGPNARFWGGGPGVGVEVPVRGLGFIPVWKKRLRKEGGREGGREGALRVDGVGHDGLL